MEQTKKVLVIVPQQELFLKLEPILKRDSIEVSRSANATSSLILATNVVYDLIVAEYPLPDLSIVDYLGILQAPTLPSAETQILLISKEDQIAGAAATYPGRRPGHGRAAAILRPVPAQRSGWQSHQRRRPQGQSPHDPVRGQARGRQAHANLSDVQCLREWPPDPHHAADPSRDRDGCQLLPARRSTPHRRQGSGSSPFQPRAARRKPAWGSSSSSLPASRTGEAARLCGRQMGRNRGSHRRRHRRAWPVSRTASHVTPPSHPFESMTIS